MKLQMLTLAMVAALVVIVSGCESLFTKQASSNSLPVISGSATTNDLAVIAYLREAQQINAAVNPTPTEPLINQALGSLILLAGAAAGFFGHRSASKSGASLTANANALPKVEQ